MRTVFGIAAGLAFAIALGSYGSARAADRFSPNSRALVEMAEIVNLSVSPDGRTAAFRVDIASVERNTYDSTWYVASLREEGLPLRIADGGTPARDTVGVSIKESPQWSPDSHWLYFRALFGSEIQVWRAARDGSRVEMLTHDPSDVESFTVSADGGSLVYEVGPTRREVETAEEQEYDAGILADHALPVGQGVFRSAWLNGRLATQRYSGEWMARAGLLADRPRRRVRLDLATHILAEEPAAAEGPRHDAAPDIDLSRTVRSVTRPMGDGRNAYLVSEEAGTKLKVIVPGRDMRNAITCSDVLCEGLIAGAAWRPRHDEIVFSLKRQQTGTAHALRAWNPTTGAVREIAVSDGLLNDGDPWGLFSTCAVSEMQATCVAASADKPPVVISIDLDSGSERLLFAPNASLAQQDAVNMEYLAWQDSQGHQFTGYLFTPAGTTSGDRLPLFITYYSCVGYLRGGIGDEWPLLPLAANGIAALCVNAAPSERAQSPDTTALVTYDTAAAGIRSVIEILSLRGTIDRGRVGMGGLSFGSEVVMWIAAKTDLLAAASIASGQLTPTYYWSHVLQPDFAERVARAWGVGSPDGPLDAWRDASPAYQTDSLNLPLLMQLPEQEYVEMFEVYARLVESQAPTEMFIFPNEPHLKFQPRHKLAAYERNLDWFRFWLQGYEDPDPLKAPQYERWERLRAGWQPSSS